MGSSIGDFEANFVQLQGEDFEYYIQNYSIILVHNSKKSTIDVDLSSLGWGLNISCHRARIFYHFTRCCFARVLNKNSCFVEGVHHLPSNPPVKLDSQERRVGKKGRKGRERKYYDEEAEDKVGKKFKREGFDGYGRYVGIGIGM